jgi:hypothetical protein
MKKGLRQPICRAMRWMRACAGCELALAIKEIQLVMFCLFWNYLQQFLSDLEATTAAV